MMVTDEKTRKYVVKFSDGRLKDKIINAENIQHAKMLARNKYGYCVVKKRWI